MKLCATFLRVEFPLGWRVETGGEMKVKVNVEVSVETSALSRWSTGYKRMSKRHSMFRLLLLAQRHDVAHEGSGGSDSDWPAAGAWLNFFKLDTFFFFL